MGGATQEKQVSSQEETFLTAPKAELMEKQGIIDNVAERSINIHMKGKLKRYPKQKEGVYLVKPKHAPYRLSSPKKSAQSGRKKRLQGQ